MDRCITDIRPLENFARCLDDPKVALEVSASTLVLRTLYREWSQPIFLVHFANRYLPLLRSTSGPPPSSAGKPAGSLFGSLSLAPTQQSASTSQPQQTSSLFGNISQPQQSGGLFGSSNQGGVNQQQQGSSIFGGASTQATGGGLFGLQQNKQQTGAGAQQSQSQPAGGLFGSLGQNQTQSQMQQPQSSLFGGLNNQNKSTSLLYVLLRLGRLNGNTFVL